MNQNSTRMHRNWNENGNGNGQFSNISQRSNRRYRNRFNDVVPTPQRQRHNPNCDSVNRQYKHRNNNNG